MQVYVLSICNHVSTTLPITAVSTGTVQHTCIFPQSTAAFMVLPSSEVLDACPSSHKLQIRPEVKANLKKLSELRHKCYVFLCAPLIGTTEQNILYLLQDNYLHSNLQFLPAHNSKECTESMFSIAKVMCKPLSTVIRERFERLRGQVTAEENVIGVLAELGVDERKSMFLLDGCGGLAGVARAAKNGELVDYNLNSSLVTYMEKILNPKDTTMSLC